jgi:hypothetical protein
MTAPGRPPREIDGKGRTIRELLSNRKYSLLARSLHEQTYGHNPAFLRFIEETGLPFRAHAGSRKKADLYAWQELCRAQADCI